MVDLSLYNNHLGDPTTVLNLARDAYNSNQFDLCCILCEAGIKLELNSNLRHEFYTLLCLSGFKTKSNIRRQRSKDLANHFSYLKNVTYDNKYEILKARSFHTNNIFQIAPSTALIPVNFVAPDRYFNCNLSITNNNDEIVGILRTVNYDSRKYNQHGFLVDDSGFVKTKNFVVKFNEKLELIKSIDLLPPVDFPEKHPSAWALGFEDARIFFLKNEIWCSSSSMNLDSNGKPQIFVSKIIPEQNIYRMVEWHQIIPKNAKYNAEKNWMPLVIHDIPYFVYNSDPVTILDQYGNIVSSKSPCIDASTYRGSSQLVPFDNGYLAIVHECVVLDKEKDVRNMLHRFVMYDHWGNLIKVSEPFYINHINMEMIIGLCWHTNKKDLIAGISFEDRRVFLMTLDSNEIRSLLNNIGDLNF